MNIVNELFHIFPAYPIMLTVHANNYLIGWSGRWCWKTGIGCSGFTTITAAGKK